MQKSSQKRELPRSRGFSAEHKMLMKPEKRLNPYPVNTIFSESQIETKTFPCEHKICLLASTRFFFLTFTRFCVHQGNLYQEVPRRTKKYQEVPKSTKKHQEVSRSTKKYQEVAEKKRKSTRKVEEK